MASEYCCLDRGDSKETQPCGLFSRRALKTNNPSHITNEHLLPSRYSVLVFPSCHQLCEDSVGFVS